MPIFTQIMSELKMITNVTRITALIFAIATITTNVKAQDIIYENADSIFIEEIARKHPNEKHKATGERIIAIANEFIGEKYIAETLEKYENEPLFISCSKLDCTTFVELVLAIAASKESSFTEICHTLEQIRYRNGVRNGYTSRLHYISWWIEDEAKQNVVEEIKTVQHTATQKLNLNFMSTHHDSYKHLKGNWQSIKEIANMERPYRNIDVKYIPKNNIKNIGKNDIKDGDIIAIVTATEGLDVSHIGLANWSNNELHMMHASSAAGKVINDTTSLNEYLAKKKNHLGIRVFRAL